MPECEKSHRVMSSDFTCHMKVENSSGYYSLRNDCSDHSIIRQKSVIRKINMDNYLSMKGWAW